MKLSGSPLLLISLTAALLLASCAGIKSPLTNASLDKTTHADTLFYNQNGKLIVLPVSINGTKKRMVFDTGADVNCIPDDSTIEGKVIRVSDSQEQVTESRLTHQVPYSIGKTTYSGSGTILTTFPELFYCIGDGVLGNTVLKSTNYKIEKGHFIFTEQPVPLDSAELVLPIFYSRSNRMRTNLIINGVRADTSLIDYGGMFELELPMRFYEQYKDSFSYHSYFRQANASSFGISGKTTTIDTTININADIILNGFLMRNVNICFSKVNEPRVGHTLLKRFASASVDHQKNQLSLGNYHNDNSAARPFYSFDLKDGVFIIDAVPLNLEGLPKIEMNQTFAEINSKSAYSFRTYCEFIDWKLTVTKMPAIEFKDSNGAIIPARLRP